MLKFRIKIVILGIVAWDSAQKVYNLISYLTENIAPIRKATLLMLFNTEVTAFLFRIVRQNKIAVGRMQSILVLNQEENM